MLDTPRMLRVPAAISRARHVLVCAALTLVAFWQSPGKIVADTKIDLVIHPAQWLARSLHLWDPSGSFGQVQNQAYGYLWPMGPFFALGTGIGLPGWVVQRLWWSLLFCVAYLGVVRLAGRLGIGTPASRVVAGIAFALSPRILTELGSVSAEAWPSAIAPWVLLPLIGIAKGASIRRSVAFSALAVFCAGGVNATAVFATVPLAFLWLLNITPLRRRLTAVAAWCGAVLAVTAWWIVPLLVLGRYSPPFLDYIETASTTTWVTDPVTVLRGASYWPAWLEGTYENQLPAGYDIARSAVPAIGTVVLASLGLTGLARRGMPHRRLLVTGLMLGFALVGLGHLGQLPGTAAPAFREFLDGAGAPLRNVHKFDVLLRLPLALGIAHLLGILTRVRLTARPLAALRRWPGIAVTAGTVAAILALATPALGGRLAAPRGFSAVPDYWRSAAAWLNERSDEGRVLVIPGARFPRYTWGDTLDEITQPLLAGESAVRSVIPLAPASTIRMMDAIEFALASGEGSPGLADYLARAGVSYLLVRNDLDYGRSITTAPLLVQQSLSRSPGLEAAVTFGPDIQSSTVDGSGDELGTVVPALQILRVDRAVDRVVAYPAEQMPTVVGGPESLLWLADAGLLPAGPTVLAGDLAAGASPGPVLLTDGLRLRDRSFGSGRDASSATLTASAGQDAHDLLPDWGPQWTTSVGYLGVADVRASTSWADKNPAGDSRPEHQAYAAFDGDPTTSWRPQLETGPGQWLEVTFAKARTVSEVTLHFDDAAGGSPTQVTVDTGAERVTLDATGPSLTFTLSGTHAVARVRIIVEGFTQTVKDGAFGITEVEIPGLSVGRTLLVPAPPSGGGPATVVLTAAAATPACFFVPSSVDSASRCAQREVRVSEDGPSIDRTLTLRTPSGYVASVWARPRAGAALDALLDSLVGGPSVSASSAAFDEPAARPGAVIDGDPGTTWRAAPGDTSPELRFTWPAARLITGVKISLSGGPTYTDGTPVGAVTVVAGGETLTGVLDHGELVFERPVVTSELSLRLRAGEAALAFDPYRNETTVLPVAVSEVSFPTADAGAAVTSRPDPFTAVDLACGSGPALAVGERTVATRLSATVRDLLERREIRALPCDSKGRVPTVGPGTVHVVASPSAIAAATRVALVPAAAQPDPDGPVTVHIDQWSATHRVVTVDAHGSDLVLAVRENTNPGWVATIGGVELTSAVVDGWQQAWVVPAGLAGRIELRYAPDSTYRAGLLAGLVALLAVVLLAAAPRRRRPPSRRIAAATRSGVVVPLLVGSGALIVTGGVLGGVIAAAAAAAVLYRAGGYQASRPPGRAGALWVWLRPWARLASWLLPAALLFLASAAWLAVYTSNYHAVPQVLGILAVASLWLSAVLTPCPRSRTTSGS